MTEDINTIADCLTVNKLILNNEKSFYVVMGQPRNNLNISININNKSIKRVQSIKLLDVELDHNLNFNTHINKL